MAPQDPTHSLNGDVVSPRNITPMILALCVIIMLDFFRGGLVQTSFLVVGSFAVGVAIFSLSHFIPKLKFTKRHDIYLTIYHAILGGALIFILPTLSYYIFLWIMLLYLSEYYYQAKGTVLSLLCLLTVLVTGTIYQNHGFIFKVFIDTLPYFTILAGTAMVLNRIVLGGRQERLQLNEKILVTEYEHERLVALINSMSEAVISTDEAGKISIYNAAALDLLDTNTELTGKMISDCIKLIDSEKRPVDILRIAQETRYISRRTDLISPINDADQLALDINISRVSMKTAIIKQEGYTFLIRDITAQKSLDEERDLFISEVSHELRTPITIAEASISMASLLAGKPESETTAIVETIEKAHKQVLFLADMVNDLSTLSRANRDTKNMAVDTFSVKEIITELAGTYAPQASKKELYLKATVDPNLPNITTSRLYFKEILQNFVTNAIKYTKTGGITVQASFHDDKTLCVSIQDTGIGISKSEQAKVFEKFWRSEDPYTRQTSGTGLGLYITSKLAMRLGAEIKIDSVVGKGTTFSILLPIVAVQPAANPTPDPTHTV